jgi:hypothetical protein
MRKDKSSKFYKNISNFIFIRKLVIYKKYNWPVCFVTLLTGHIKDTRRLVVAISLSGSAVNFSLTLKKREKTMF